MNDDYSELTTGIPNKNMCFCFAILRHKGALCKQATLPPYSQIRVKMAATMSGLIHSNGTQALSVNRTLCFPCQWDL